MRMCVDRREQCSHDKRYRMRRQDRETDDLSGKEIKSRGKVDDLAVKGNMREVRCPDVMRVARKFREKQIRERYRIILWFPKLSASSPVGPDPEDTHDSFNLFPVHLK